MFAILAVIAPLGHNLAFAMSDDIDKKLIKITQIADNKEALRQLADLLIYPKLTTKQYISAVNLQAQHHISLDNFAQATALLQQAQVIAQDQKRYQLEADTNKLLGVTFYYQGNNSKALMAYQASYSFYQTIDAPIKQANLLNNIALVHAAMANYTLALQNYKLAETIYQNFGSEEDKVDVRYNIALMHVNMRRYDSAIKILHEVVLKRKEMNDDLELAMAWANLGISYKHSGQFQQAKSYLLNALNYFELHNQRHQIASQMHNLAEVHIELNQPIQAKKYAKKGIEISLAVGHKKAHAGSLNSLAKALFHQGDIKQALEKITLSNKIARETNYKTLLNSNLALLSLIYATQNNTAEALSTHLNYLHKQHDIQNDLFNIQLARFESDQLIGQVEQLIQNKKLLQAQNKQKEQLQYFFIFAAVLILVILFFGFRRNIEKNAKRALESKVKQRTQELEFLMQELQRANKIKSQFLANMSTDIKTPLTKVIEQSELILNENVSSKVLNKEVEIILGNSLHLLQLINDILDLSKLEENTLELDLKQQDINNVITEVAELYTEQSKTKGLTFELHNTLTSPFIVSFDALRLKQILINFCSNALKFTHKGKVMLSVSFLNNELIFSVIDTGVGMNKIQLKQIFDSFNQGDSSINRRFGGSGLGLFISEQLASIMGGQISAQSTLNQGTTFTFTLPIQPNK